MSGKVLPIRGSLELENMLNQLSLIWPSKSSTLRFPWDCSCGTRLTSPSSRAPSGQPGLLGQLLCALCHRERRPSVPRHKMIKGLLRPQKPIHPAQGTKGQPWTLVKDSRPPDLCCWEVSRTQQSPLLTRCTLERTLSLQPTVGSRPGTSMHMPQQRNTGSVPLPFTRLFRDLSLEGKHQPAARVPVRSALKFQFLTTLGWQAFPVLLWSRLLCSGLECSSNNFCSLFAYLAYSSAWS